MRLFKACAFLVSLFCSLPIFAAPPITVGVSNLHAQVTGGGHSVALTWTLSIDDTTTNCTTTAGCVQTVFRGNGSCATAVLSVFSSTVPAATSTFTDSSPVPGTICYGISFTINGVESPKDVVTVTLQPFAPTAVAGTGH